MPRSLTENPHILILDNNPVDVALVEGLLVGMGYEQEHFLVVSLLRDAIELVYERSFSFVLLDMQLPDAQGTEAIQQLVACDASLPVIVMSDDGGIEDALACGAQEVISKSDLILKLQEALRRALLRKKADVKVRYRATHDPLTAIFNRSHFMESVERSLTRNNRYGTGCGVIYIDLDKFKPVNDTYGHHAGDLALKIIASRLQQTIRDGDLLARIGGDEFAVLIEDVQDQDRLRTMSNRIIALLSEPIAIDPASTVQVSCSLGLALVQGHHVTNAYDVMKAADSAMFDAKNNGGRQLKIVNVSGNLSLSKESDLTLELQGAMLRNEFFIVFQPQMRLEPSSLMGLEVLLRWDRHNGPRIGPDQFIPMLENSGQIVEVGAWVLREAVSRLSEWSKRVGKAPPRIGVNVSPVQLGSTHFLDNVEAVLKDFNFDPKLLELEITETTLIHNTGIVQQTLQSLRNLGVRLVLDDFGTGFASLSYLIKHPVNGIKIDQSFVAPLEHDSNSRILVESVIDLAHRLGVDLVAEGVENHYQVEFLRKASCDAVQGYLFGSPGSLASWDIIMRL